MRNQKIRIPLGERKAAKHAADEVRARGKIKHFDYIQERQVNGMVIRDGVLCKCCGEPLITTVEVDAKSETRRQKNHTMTTRYLTQAATPAYRVVSIELDNGALYQTPLCQPCAQSPHLDLQAIFTADIERLHQQGMDISFLVDRVPLRVVSVEVS